MNQNPQIKPTVLLLTGAFVFLAGPMVSKPVTHSLHHGKAANLYFQHSSFKCPWMGGAGNTTSSSEHLQSFFPDPMVETQMVLDETVLYPQPIGSFFIRPPPVFSV